MPLTPAQAEERAHELRDRQVAERVQLDEAWRYLHGRQALPAVIPTAAPPEVHRMARIARVNVASIVVEALAQSLAVVGYRGRRDADNVTVWDAWQANRLDARQGGIHRATLTYGTAYAVVLPGDPVPVVRGVSPRALTALYGSDPDWPEYALERGSGGGWRLFEADAVHDLVTVDQRIKHRATAEHRIGVTPVIRYLAVDDLDRDDPAPVSGPNEQMRTVVEPTTGLTIPVASGSSRRLVAGEVGPLMDLQDQIDLITFNLLVAQHFTAFRQRYIIGWVAPDEATRVRASAALLLTFDEDPDKVRIGEFAETNLDGYIRSREASLRHAASLSQTPVHELIGELVNLSAEALAAAEAGRDRKVSDRQTMLGESHEQMLGLVGRLMGVEVPADAQVRWRNTSARSVAAVIDALGKATQMLGIPPSELWEQVASVLDVTMQDVERWKVTAQSGDAFANLTTLLERQAGVA